MRSSSKLRSEILARKRLQIPPQEAHLSLGRRIKIKLIGSPTTVITLAVIGLAALGMLLLWASPHQLAELLH